MGTPVTNHLPGGTGRGVLGWLVEACMAVLVGALALTAAVWLLEAIWPALVIVAGCVAGITVIVLGVRWWLGRW